MIALGASLSKKILMLLVECLDKVHYNSNMKTISVTGVVLHFCKQGG